MDTISQKRRSENMRRIRSKDTVPELVVRRVVYRMGFRYRLHARFLPGRPDLVFRSRKKAIFVHGCFWHQHSQCIEGRVPGSRSDYWGPKLERNKTRDLEHLRVLKQMGWKTLVLWECEMRDISQVMRKLHSFLHR